jgi:hypothetical protein
MREAKLVSLSPDGRLILAVAETGEEVAVGIDDRLRAAVRGDRVRLGQLETTMESALRPRDIQARIRAGESPESVAQVAQMPVERVMAFAGPVLAERDHIASIAQRASVRRRGGTDAPVRNLGTWVTERLRSRAVDPNSAEWDAWRREDGRWAVRVVYSSDERLRTAMFAYDAPGRYAVPDDDEARWLVGEQTTAAAAHPGVRRLAAVDHFDIAPDHGADSYEAGFEQALSVARETERRVERPIERQPDRHAERYVDRHPEPPVERPVDRHRPVVDHRPRVVPPVEDDPVLPDVEVAAPPARPHVVRPGPGPDEEETVALDRPAAEPEASAAGPATGPAEDKPAEEPKKRTRRKNQRASVPSWDEIMFGKKAD